MNHGNERRVMDKETAAEARLRAASDIVIGGEAYRVSVNEMRIKVRPNVRNGAWKVFQKFGAVEEMEKNWDGLVYMGKPAATSPGIVVREVVAPDQVLPPQQGGAGGVNAAAGTGYAGDADALPHTPAALAEQYGRAMAGLRECIRFGAMLVEVESCLSRQTARHANQHGENLKAWMAANCPAVDYGWALKYKRLAEGMREACNIPARVPLSLAIPPAEGAAAPVAAGVPEKRLARINREVAAFLDGKTARQLEFTFGLREPPKPTGGSREGAGRPSARQADSVTRAGAAWGLIGREIDRATAWHFERFLPEAMAREALSTVGILRDALKARLAEIGKGGGDVDER